MKGVLRWRTVRWVLAAAALPVIWACNSPPLAPPSPAPERTVEQVFQAAVNRDIDILFMVDNSLSMAPLQDKLTANFPVFMNTLSGLPGGLPNVHIAVVSSDLGAGPTAPVPNCLVGGGSQGGKFQSTPRIAGCTSGLGPNDHYFSSINGMANFTGDIATDFACVAKLGQSGCGFEHQFASYLRALEPGPLQPPENVGFLRPDAFLSVILITNEDDCSAPPDSGLFDTASMTVADPLGPLASFRCNEFGHLCNGKKPPRTPAVLDNCVSAEDGQLLRVADVVARTKKLKNNDTSKIIVAAVTGDFKPYGMPLPYEVIIPDDALAQAQGYVGGVPNIKHSCYNPNDNTYGDPSVRISEWVTAFGGTFVSICNDTFKPALTQIAMAIGAAIGPQCVAGKLVDSDLKTDGLQPECVVTDVGTDANGKKTETLIHSCAADPAMPCWTVMPNSQTCMNGGNLVNVMRTDKPSNVNTSVQCAVCITGVSNPGCNY
ncbi:MAG TPA: hypothetical protein VMU50_02535 [Polyangia bacterium]|nr:hypothetical protein [Polyangia bacterium]